MNKQKLNEYLGKRVEITLNDYDVVRGRMQYIDKFDGRHKPKYYLIQCEKENSYTYQDLCFKASHVKIIKILGE